MEQERQLLQNLDEVNAKIDNYKKLEKEQKERSYQEDDLDDFMSTLSSETLIDKTEIRKLRVSVIYSSLAFSSPILRAIFSSLKRNALTTSTLI